MVKSRNILRNAEITERLITMLKSGGATEEYIELDDLIL